MKKIWSDKAWEDYLYWQTQDKKNAQKNQWRIYRHSFLQWPLRKLTKKIPNPNGLGIFCKSNIREN